MTSSSIEKSQRAIYLMTVCVGYGINTNNKGG
jgi:hypothetical protein